MSPMMILMLQSTNLKKVTILPISCPQRKSKGAKDSFKLPITITFPPPDLLTGSMLRFRIAVNLHYLMLHLAIRHSVAVLVSTDNTESS